MIISSHFIKIAILMKYVLHCMKHPIMKEMKKNLIIHYVK